MSGGWSMFQSQNPPHVDLRDRLHGDRRGKSVFTNARGGVNRWNLRDCSAWWCGTWISHLVPTIVDAVSAPDEGNQSQLLISTRATSVVGQINELHEVLRGCTVLRRTAGRS